jgi:hypothetical protein
LRGVTSDDAAPRHRDLRYHRSGCCGIGNDGAAGGNDGAADGNNGAASRNARTTDGDIDAGTPNSNASADGDRDPNSDLSNHRDDAGPIDHAARDRNVHLDAETGTDPETNRAAGVRTRDGVRTFSLSIRGVCRVDRRAGRCFLVGQAAGRLRDAHGCPAVDAHAD